MDSERSAILDKIAQIRLSEKEQGPEWCGEGAPAVFGRKAFLAEATENTKTEVGTGSMGLRRSKGPPR